MGAAGDHSRQPPGGTPVGAPPARTEGRNPTACSGPSLPEAGPHPRGVHKGGVARVMPTTMGPPLKRDRARQVWEGSLGPAFKEIQPPSLDRKKGRKREPSDAGLCIISPSMLCSSRALYTSPFTSSRWYSRHASKGSPHSSSPRPAAAPRARASVRWQTDAPTPKQSVSGIKTSSVPRRSNSRDKNPHFPKWGQQAKNLPEM